MQISLLTSLTALAYSVTAHPASPLSVALATEQFKNALLVPQIFPTFEPSGTVSVNFSTTVKIITNGQAIPIADAQVKPTISIKGTAVAEATVGGPFNGTTLKYTVMIVDAGVAGNTNTSALVRHYLQNDLEYGTNSDHSVLLTNSTAPITEYAGPAPPSGSGPHRYVILAFQQPANFTPPAALSAAGTGVGRFDPNAYISSTGLVLLAAQYFTVEVGTATVSVAATTAVDSTTLPQYTPTSSPLTATGSSGTAAPASTSKAAGGERTRVGVLALVGGLVFAMVR
ncbi:hypothetical protein RQP46_010924 [Phenoliferia psychrophenolica]